MSKAKIDYSTVPAYRQAILKGFFWFLVMSVGIVLTFTFRGETWPWPIALVGAMYLGKHAGFKEGYRAGHEDGRDEAMSE